jgi:hypothetical protein
MDTSTIITSIISSLGVSVTGAWWLSQQLITYRLGKEKDRWQGEIRKEVEVYLGDKSAEREYNLDARKRLYSAIGPLRFQLLLACRDVSTRINNYGSDDLRYSMTMRDYYGKSTLYRLLRPIAIAELVERQITYADFSVDPTGVELLRFKKAAFMAFTDGDTILEHPDANWGDEKEHVFSGTLGRLASELIIRDEDIDTKERPMHFHEFQTFIHKPALFDRFSPLKGILNDFTISKKPIFWIRLVCFAYICNEYLGEAGRSIGFEKREFNARELLLVSKDPHIRSNVEKYQEIFQSLISMPL